MPFRSQKVAEKQGSVEVRRAVSVFLAILIVLSNSTITVLAGEFAMFEPKFLSSDVLTDEIETLSGVKPELKENYADQRKEKIQETRDGSEKWTERIVLGKLEGGSEVSDVVGHRKDAEKVVADLKAAGAVTTLADATTGAEKEINPKLEKDADILKTNSTPYATEISTASKEPIVLAENSDASGDVVSAVASDKQVAEDTTPDVREEVRYFNWNANKVEGSHEENKILYQDLWDATDLLVTTSETGVKEDLILKNALAPTDFQYIVETVGLELQTKDDGGYVFVDSDGNEKFYTPPPNLTDANGQFIEDGIRYELGWGAEEQVEDEEVVQEIAQVDPTLAEIKFDENSNEKFIDEKSDAVGEISGGRWIEDGVWGGALLLDAENGSATIPRDFATPATATISAWVKSGAYQTGQIAGFGSNVFRQNERNGFEVAFRIGDKNFVLNWKTSALYLEQWYYLAATFDGATIRFYVDGEEKNSLAIETANALAATDAPITFGGNFAGVVDEFRVYNRALSVDEVAALHEQYLGEEVLSSKTIPTDEPEITVEDEAEVTEEIEVIDESELQNSEEEIEVIEEADLEQTTTEATTPTATEEVTETGVEGLESLESVEGLEGSEGLESVEGSESVEGLEGSESLESVEGSEGLESSESSEGSENGEATTESAAATETPVEEIPAEAEAVPEETTPVEPTPAETDSAAEPAPESSPTEETPAEVEANATTFFDTLRNFFVPTAVAEIEKFDEAVSIEQIVDSNTATESERTEVVTEPLVEEPVVEDPVVTDEVVEEVPVETEADVSAEETPADGLDAEAAIPDEVAGEQGDAVTEEEPTAETEVATEVVTPDEAETTNDQATVGDEEVSETEAAIEATTIEEAATTEDSTTGEEVSEEEVDTTPEAEVVPIEETLDPDIEIEVIDESDLPVEEELQVIDESEVEKFFAPETVDETRIKVAPESKIVVLTEQEAFAETNRISEEIQQDDGTILRRYKLRLVVDVAAKTEIPQITVVSDEVEPVEEISQEVTGETDEETQVPAAEEIVSEEVNSETEAPAEEVETSVEETTPTATEEVTETGVEGLESLESSEGSESVEGSEGLESVEGSEGSEGDPSTGSTNSPQASSPQSDSGQAGSPSADADSEEENTTETPATETEAIPTDSEETTPTETEVVPEETTPTEIEVAPEETTPVEPTPAETDSAAEPAPESSPTEETPAEVENSTETVEAQNLGASILDFPEVAAATPVIDFGNLPKTLKLASGVELAYPIDVDPSTYITLVNRGARTFAPNFAEGSPSGTYSQTNVPNSINRGTEAVTGAQIALSSLSSNLRDGLVGYWPMNDDWTDSENSNDGTAAGSATFDTSGKFSSAGSFDGVDSLVAADSLTTSLADHTNGSIGLWLKITDNAALQSIFSVSRDADSTMSELSLISDSRGDSNALKLFAIQDDNYLFDYSTAVGFLDDYYDEWIYVVVTQNGVEPKLYVNGSEVTFTAISANTSDATKWFKSVLTDASSVADKATIGAQKRNSTTIRYLDGEIDDLAIYSRALGSSEVSQIYNGGRTIAASTNTVLVDVSGAEFLGSSLTDSQDWTAVSGTLRTNTVGTKIKFTTPIAAPEIWAGLNFSPAGGVIRATIDKATDREITTEIDTYASADASAQKTLLATGLRNSTHTVELELISKTNPRRDTSDASDYRFSLDYFENYRSQSELSGAGIASTADSGTTTTIVDTALTQADDYWNGYALEFTSGSNNGETVFVSNFDAATDTLTFTPAVDTAVTTETFKLSPDGILIGTRATRGIATPPTPPLSGGGIPTFEILDNFPTDTSGLTSKGTFSIWVSPDFDSDADTAKHFVFDSGLQRLYYDGSDDKFKFEVWDGDDFVTADVESAAQTFSAYDSLHLVTAWDYKTGLKLFVTPASAGAGFEKTAKSVAWAAQDLSEADTQISFGKCGTRSATEFTAAETYFSGVLAEPQIWNYVLLDSEIFGVYTSAVPSVGQSHAQKIEARSASDSALLFNAPLVGTPNDRVGSLAGSAKLDSTIAGEVATISATDGQEPNWIEDGRVSYWNFDGNFEDSSGSNDGTASSGVVATATGKFGSAADFDGVDDYVDLGDPADGSLDPTNALTILAWIYPESDGGGNFGRIISNVSRVDLFVQAENGGYVDMCAQTNGLTDACVSGNYIPINQWSNVAVVYTDGNSRKFYVNGSMVAANDSTNSLSDSADAKRIGNRLDGTRAFDGVIDDLAIYNRALSADEIAQFYYKDALKFYGDPLAQVGGVLNAKDLVGYWKMDGDFTDAVNSNDATANGGVVATAAGRFNSAADFDGSDDYISIPDDADFDLSGDMSISLWVKLANNSNQCFIHKGDGTAGGGGLCYGFESHGFQFIAYNKQNAPYATRYSNDVGQWHHLAGVVKNGVRKLYLDGNYVDSSSTGEDSWNNDSNLVIGAAATLSYKSGAALDEVAVFGRALSDSEISSIYAAQSGSYANFTTPEATTEIVAGLDVGPDQGISRITIDADTPREVKTEVDTYAAASASSQRFLVATGLDSGEHTVKIESSGVKNLNSTTALIVPKFIETNSQSAVSSSALTVNNRLIDDVIVPDYSRLPNAITFPEKGNISELNNAGTLEFWATGSLASGDHFVDTRDSSGNNGLRLYMNSANSLTFEFNNANESVSIADADFATSYSSAAANHVLARWWQPTSTTLGMTLYIDGQKIAENVSQTFTPTEHSQIVIGNDSTPDATADFDGSIYDFAVYPEAFDDGGVALNSNAVPNSAVWVAANSKAEETLQITSLQIDSDTTVNATDGSTTTFYLDRGALAQKIFEAESYDPQNYDFDIPLRLAAEDNVELSQQFETTTSGTIPSVSLWLKRVGSPSGDLTLTIQTDSSDLPSGTMVTNGTATTVAADSISSSDYEWVTFKFATPPTLTGGTAYHLVLSGDFTASESNYIVWATDTSSPDYSDGTSEIKDSAWAESSEDFIFKVFQKYSLANSIDAFVDGVEVSVDSVSGGSFARINESGGISALATSFEIDSAIDSDEIPESGFLWIGNPSSNFKREKVYFGNYSGGTFSNLKRGIDGTMPGAWADNTIVEVSGAVTLASAPADSTDLFIKYNYSGDALARYSGGDQNSVFFLGETANAATGWATTSTDSDKTTTVAGQTAFTKLRGTEISAVLDRATANGGVTQFVIDEGTRKEKRVLTDLSDETAIEKIKSLATDLADKLHTLRIVANVANGKNSGSAQTRVSAFQTNGYAPLLEPAASSVIAYAEPLADLNPEDVPDNYINLENAIGGNDSYTKLLIHSDTTDGSTAFEDSSQSAHTVTATGEVHHETDEQEFGTSSIQFDGTGDYLSVADSDDWDFGSEDFTVDFWINLGAKNMHTDIIGSKVDGGNGWRILFSNKDATEKGFSFYSSGGNIMQSADTLTLDEWTHVAYVRSNGVLKIYQNGVEIASGSITSLADSGRDLYLGIDSRNTTTYPLTGYLDEIRISKGVARWTDDFTPPTGPYDIDIPTVEGVAQLALVEGLDSNRVNGVDYWDTSADADGTWSMEHETEQRVNLLADLTSSATEATVESVADLPSSGVVKIDDEYLKYGAKGTDGVSSKLLNLQRGYNDTTAAAHAMADSEEIIAGLSNVRDVFLYDTSKDSIDSGWRFDATKSWYSETSSATRCPNGFADSGSTKCTRAFPAVALLIATDDHLYIYDAESRELWMQFVGNNNAHRVVATPGSGTPNDVFALDGKIYLGQIAGDVNSLGAGISTINFSDDTIFKRLNTTSAYSGKFNGDISGRNQNLDFDNQSYVGIIDNIVSDVSVAVIDGKTFVAIATDGGVSIINESDGTVVDITDTSESSAVSKVWLTNSGELYFVAQDATDTDYYELLAWYVIPTSDQTSYQDGDAYYSKVDTLPIAPNTNSVADISDLFVVENGSTIDSDSNQIILGYSDQTDSAVTILNEKQGDESNGSIKYLTTDYITEELVGDTKGSWSFDDSTNLVDNSVNSNNLTNSSGVTFATAGVRGNAASFDGASWLTAVDDDSLNFGSDTDFSIGAWIKTDSTSAHERVMSKYGSDGWIIKVDNGGTGKLQMYLDDETSAYGWLVSSDSAVNDDAWHQFVITLGRNGYAKVYIDGVYESQADISAVGNLSSVGSPLYIGRDSPGAYRFEGLIDEPFITAEALDAATVSRMYQTGKNALASANEQKLAGSSNIVKSVAVIGDSLYVVTDGGSSDDGAISKINLNSDSRVKAIDTSSSFGGTTIGTLDPVAVAANSAGVAFADADEAFVDFSEIQTVGTIAAAASTSSTDTSWQNSESMSWHDEFGDLPEKVYLLARESGIDIIDAVENDLWASFTVGTGNALDSRVNAITHSESTIFAATESGVVKFDLASDAISKFIGQKEFSAESCDGEGTADFSQIDSGNFCFSDERPLHDDSLAAKFDFELVVDSETLDASSNANDATVYGDTNFTADGVSGRAVTLDGNGDYISVADDSSLDASSAVTVSAWIYPTTTTGDVLVVAKGYYNSGSDNGGYFLRRNGTGWECDIAANAWGYAHATNAVTLNEWQFVSCVYDGSSTIKAYKNGALLNSTNTAAPSSIKDVTQPLGIGYVEGSVNWGGYFAGKVDAVSVSKRALSAAEIADLYTAGLASLRSGNVEDITPQPPLSGGLTAFGTKNVEDATESKTFVIDQNIHVDPSVLRSAQNGTVAEYDFDDSTTTVADRSGNAKTAVIAGDTTFTADGISGLAATLDGTGDYFRTPDLTSLFTNESVTVGVWFKADAAGVVVDEIGQTTLDTGWHNSQIEVLSTGEVKARVWDLSPVSLGTVGFGEWHHAILRYDKSGLVLDGFLDGVEAGSDVSGDRLAPWEQSAATYYAFGAADSTNLGSGAYFDGIIDEAKIYGRAITDAEALALYNSGRQVIQSADTGAAVTAVHFDSSGNLYTATNSQITKTLAATLATIAPFAADATKLTSAIDATIMAINDLTDDATNLYAATDIGVEKLLLSDLSRVGEDTFLANSGGANNLLVGSTNEVRAVAYDSTTTELAIGTTNGTSGTGAVSILREIASTPLLERSYDQATSSGDALVSDLTTALNWMADYRSNTSASYRKLLVASEKGYSIVGVHNLLPNIPTLVSPPSGWQTTDTTPTLSAMYSGSEASDTGYTNYRIAAAAADCLSGTSLTDSGTSSLTSTNSEATTWTASEIATDGTYYWCAQNDDGEDTSAWTSMGNFVLDTATPDIVAIDAGPSSVDRTSFTSDTLFGYSDTGSDGQVSFTWTDPASDSDDEFYYALKSDPETELDSLVGWWKLDEEPDGTSGEITDSSSTNNDGTSSGMAATESTAGIIDSAITFDGTDDYIDAGSDVADFESAGTVAMWIYANSQGGLFSRSTGTGWLDERYVLHFYGSTGTTGYVRLAISDGTSYANYNCTDDLPLNQWVYLTVTHDGSNIKFYQNGEFVNLVAQTKTPEMTGVKTWIGRVEGLNPNFFNGQLDDVKIWNKALTATQIQQEYARGRVIDNTGLVGWWKLDESPTGAASEIQDSSGNGNNVTTAGSMNSEDSVSGVLGDALDFDGSDDYIEADLTDTITDYTESAWIKVPEKPNSNFTLFAHNSYADNNSTSKVLKINASGNLAIDDYMPSSGLLTGSIDIADDTWHFVTATRDGTTRKIYVDGALDISQADAEVYSGTAPTHFVVGYDKRQEDQGYEFFAGAIDDVRLYSRALSATEVANLYYTRVTTENTLDDFPTHYPAADSTDALTTGRNYLHVRPMTLSGKLGTERSFIADYSGGAPTIDAASLKIYGPDGITEITEGATVTNQQAVKIKPDVTDPTSDAVITVFKNLTTALGSFVATDTPTTENADGLGNPACVSGTAYDDCASKVWYEMSPSGDYTLTPYDPTIEVSDLPEGDYRVRTIATDESMPNLAVGYGSGESTGWISLHHTDTEQGSFYADNYLQGWALSENAGWIQLRSGSPATTDCSEQPTQTATDYGVMSDGYGNLCGYGYSEIFGWISFMGDGYQVSVTADHQLIGQAFSEAIGWVSFTPSEDAATPNLCLMDGDGNFGCSFDGYEYEPGEYDLSVFDAAVFQ